MILQTLTLDELRVELRAAQCAPVGENGSLVALCPCCSGELKARRLEDSTVQIDCGCDLDGLADKLNTRAQKALQAPADETFESARRELSELLEIQISHARIVGRGSRASADLYLTDGSEITFETLRDFLNPTRLCNEIVACTGATPNLKLAQARKAAALLRTIADHQEALTADQFSIEWGMNYLQDAPVLDVDMNDQGERWAAFCRLKENEHAVSLARLEGSTVARASIVLRHTDGSRYVRCGWFRAHAKQDDAAVSPQEIANRMLRVGWEQRGRAGRIKATRPGFRESHVWTFYVVPDGWETNQ